MLELNMYNIRKYFGDNLVLWDAGFKLYEGDRAGMVGANGSGKSTILKLLAGILPMDVDYRKICEGKSRISYPSGTTLAYLDQLPSIPDGYRVIDVLKLAFQELYDLEEQLGELECAMAHLQGEALDKNLNQYSRLQQRYEAKGGYEKDEKLSKVCTGLKFDNQFLDREFRIISGGEKNIVMLGKILLENPDILLLDEPTNHLDMEAAEWLENHLKGYRGIVILVSHDRYFLDHVVTKIIEVENKQCETYLGNYSDYVRQKEDNMLLQYENYKEQCKTIHTMEQTIRDLRGWALQADNNKFFRRAVSMERKLDRMQRINRPVFEKQSIRIDFKETDHSGSDVIKVAGLSKHFGERHLFRDAELLVTKGERIALIGPNGCGKSTLIKILLGELSPDSGNTFMGYGLKTAYLPQIIAFRDEDARVIDCFREDRSILEGKAREYLAKFMFFGKAPFRKVKQLSGGERVRLKLAMLLYEETNFLILDEPTNHLDIDSIEVLEEALEEFKGTLFFVSHDRYFINKVCSRIVAIEDGKLVSYPGNYDSYREKKLEGQKSIDNVPAMENSQKTFHEKTADPKRSPVSTSGGNSRERTDPSGIESAMKALESQMQLIEQSMSEPDISYEELNGLYNKKVKLEQELDRLLGQWIR